MACIVDKCFLYKGNRPNLIGQSCVLLWRIWTNMTAYVNLWGCGYAAHISSGNILYNLPQIHYIIGIETSNIVINQLSSPIRVLVSNLVLGMTAIDLFPYKVFPVNHCTQYLWNMTRP